MGGRPFAVPDPRRRRRGLADHARTRRTTRRSTGARPQGPTRRERPRCWTTSSPPYAVDDAAAGARLGATPAARRDLAGVARNARAAARRRLLPALRRLLRCGRARTAPGRPTWPPPGGSPGSTGGSSASRCGSGSRLPTAGCGSPASAGETGVRRCGSPGPVQVRRTAHSMVLVGRQRRPGPTPWRRWRAARCPRYAGCCRTGPAASWSRCRRPKPAWRRRWPPTPASTTGIAAVTTSVDGSRSRAAPSHVFVNPRVFAPLRPRGAQVVITHEATHVATRAGTSPAPIWLVEGFADYVALSSQRLPVTTTAARIIALVRRERRSATTCPGARSSRPVHRTSRRATRAPGWPAGCWPRTAAGRTWSRSTRRSTPAARCRPSCAGTSVSGRSPSPGSGGPSCHTCRRDVNAAGPWSRSSSPRSPSSPSPPSSSPGTRCPAARPPPVRESDVFTQAQIARANAYSDPARHLGWASLAVSMLVTLVLGLTPLGRRLAARLRGWWWVRVLPGRRSASRSSGAW